MQRLLLLLALLIPALCLAQNTPNPLSLIAFDATVRGQPSILLIRADGNGRAQLIPNASNPAFSADSRRIAFVRGADIYVANADGTGQTQVTKHGLGVFVRDPQFSQDGQRLVFTMGPVVPEPVTNIQIVNVDGTGETTLATNGTDPIFSPDGVMVIFARGAGIYSVLMNNMGDDNQTPTPLFERGVGVTLRYPMFTPNSAQVLYVSLPVVPNPMPNIYIANANGSNDRQLINNATQPSISTDGNWITFIQNGNIYAADSNGKNVSRVTSTVTNESNPVWAPNILY